MEFYEKAKDLLSKNQLEECHDALNKLIDSRNGISSNGPSLQVLADAYNTRGHIKYLWVDFDAAILDYTEAIQCDPSLAVAYYNRGQIHYRMGRYSLAEVDLLQALKLKPDFTDAALNLRQVQKDVASGHKFNI